MYLKIKSGAGNEIQLTDAIDTLNKTQRVLLVSLRRTLRRWR